MTIRCDLTDLLAAECAHCRGLPNLDAALTYTPLDAGVPGPATKARFPGRCAGCDEPFRPGQTIRSDGAGGWIADCCHDQ